MKWNWQKPEWPKFEWCSDRLARAEEQFSVGVGIIEGVSCHIDIDMASRFVRQRLGEEAVSTSEIEGEIPNRESVQSSIRKHLGLSIDSQQGSASEEGVAELMVLLYQSSQEPLTSEVLYSWHEMLMRGKRLQAVGSYRRHVDPMKILSGKVGDSMIHLVPQVVIEENGAITNVIQAE